MTSLQILLLALLLDYLIGDPDTIWRRYPHPAVIMGRVIDLMESRFNDGGMLRPKGIILISILSLSTFLFGLIVHSIPDFGVLELILTTILLAHNSLVKHVKDVSIALRESLSAGRASVARIVGRDTSGLDESEITRAAIESAAENFSDAVVAPVFWYLLLGLPGLLTYKMINTADSMIGHRTERFHEFGYGAAKLDDIVNYIPARLCGALMCGVFRSRDSFDIMMSDADLHASPNAGWPEAAMAAILDVMLSGPRAYYGGKMSDDSYINPRGRKTLTPEDIDGSLNVLNRSWFAMLGFVATLVFLVWLL